MIMYLPQRKVDDLIEGLGERSRQEADGYSEGGYCYICQTASRCLSVPAGTVPWPSAAEWAASEEVWLETGNPFLRFYP